ncbi:MAG: hypothetical protein PT120_24295 [Aphanizomenon gracile PMC649.10]|nr:hypothetical protein [Aphanizomenon gracile PMC649.10]
MISARGLDSVLSFGYAYGINGKVCAHIYKVFIYQDNYFPNKFQKQGNKKIIFVLIAKIPRCYFVSQDKDAITSLDVGELTAYQQELINSGRIKRIYLDELPPGSIGMGLIESR